MALDRDTTFTWNGHSCFEIRSPGGKALVLDPFLANPNSPKTADQVEACDVMLVTHGHFDHMGDAVAIAARVPVAGRVIGVDHRDLDAGDLDGPALVHADRGVHPAGQPATEPQAHLVDARPRRAMSRGDGDRTTHVVEVAV